MGLELAFVGELLQRLAFKDAVVAREILADASVKHAVTAVHKARFLIGFLGERGDGAFGDGEFAKSAGWFHGVAVATAPWFSWNATAALMSQSLRPSP